MNTLHSSILDTIGNTPIVRLARLAPAGVDLFVKLEAFNPGGSIKDRLAKGIIEATERYGTRRPGQTVVEATSGNTGIGLALVCAQKGYPLVVVMAENFSIERRKLMRFLGAKVLLAPASEKGSGMIAKARELAEAHGWFLARQFENEASADVHSATTAPVPVAAKVADPTPEALEWGEFCWSVRKLFAAAGIAYRSVDLDGAERRDRSAAIRSALVQRTGISTIPQIFVCGRHIGGATETLGAFADASLPERLSAYGIACNPTGVPDPKAFLPGWLHPRSGDVPPRQVGPHDHQAGQCHEPADQT